jgi:hypothetical protein
VSGGGRVVYFRYAKILLAPSFFVTPPKCSTALCGVKRTTWMINFKMTVATDAE